MRRQLIAILVGALAICGISGSSGAAPPAPANNPYSQEYVRVLDEIKHQFLEFKYVKAPAWDEAERQAGHIGNQRDLEFALRQLPHRVYPDLQLLSRSDSDELRARMTPG